MQMVGIKMSEEDKKKLKKDAYAHEMNISEYVRWLIQKERCSECDCGMKR